MIDQFISGWEAFQQELASRNRSLRKEIEASWTAVDAALEIGFESAACSPFLLSKKKIVTLVAHGYDRGPYLRLRIKAYVYDHRYEPRMMSDITRRATREFIRRGILQHNQASGIRN